MRRLQLLAAPSRRRGLTGGVEVQVVGGGAGPADVQGLAAAQGLVGVRQAALLRRPRDGDGRQHLLQGARPGRRRRPAEQLLGADAARGREPCGGAGRGAARVRSGGLSQGVDGKRGGCLGGPDPPAAAEPELRAPALSETRMTSALAAAAHSRSAARGARDRGSLVECIRIGMGDAAADAAADARWLQFDADRSS